MRGKAQRVARHAQTRLQNSREYAMPGGLNNDKRSPTIEINNANAASDNQWNIFTSCL